MWQMGVFLTQLLWQGQKVEGSLIIRFFALNGFQLDGIQWQPVNSIRFLSTKTKHTNME